MNVLVTGGAGYIGSHICLELLSKDYEVTVLDNLSNSQISSLLGVSKLANKKLNYDIDKNANFTFYEADLRNAFEVEKLFSCQKIDAVIHLAGLKSVRDSIINSTSYYSNNVLATINLLNVMKKFNCKIITFSSSATVYGDAENAPFKENSKLSPVNPYGENKLEIESILQNFFYSDTSWSIAILRFFNPIGAHQSGIIGESPNDVPNNLMPLIMEVAVNNLKTLNIYGNDYITHDGTAIRDYIHVLDISSGHIKAIEALTCKPQIFTLNLGTGIGHSVFDVVKSFEKASGKKITFKISSRREGDMAVSYADCTLAKNLLGWSARYNLDEMCQDSWNFFLKKSNLIENPK
jgi:UDP-glucose 4-epimerase